jgi:hypothetical protein
MECTMLSARHSEEAVEVEAARGEQEEQKVRCLCGKWWCYRSGDRLVLRCKLCRRDIVITGENLRISYR